MKRILICMLCALLLTGCTDVRTRRSPDVLALDTAEPSRAAMHATQNDEIISAGVMHPLLFREALENAAGAEISPGHLSLLMISGNPAPVLPELLQSQEIAPTCKVLYVPDGACRLLESGNAPETGQLDAAVSTGMLPLRTADLIYGDLCGGSGVSAVPAWLHERLTLMLLDADGVQSALSENACRGLALLGGRFETFSFDADGAPCTVRSVSLRISAAVAHDQLCISVCGSVRAETAHRPAAELLLSEMVSSALTETAQAAGADLLFLYEAACKSRLPGIRSCSQSQWRSMLMTAAYQTDLRVTA